MIKYLICILALSSNLYPQDTLSINPKGILSNYSNSQQSQNSYFLEKDYIDFDGYLIIKFQKSDLVLHGGFYHLEIFWINNLSEIKSFDKRVYYEYLSEVFMSTILSSDKDTSKVISNFMKNYRSINRNREKKTYLYYSFNNNLDGSIFLENNYVWTNSFNYYLIFKTKFKTALLKSNIDQGVMFDKIFIPVSDLLEFEPVNNSEILEEKGFIKKEVLYELEN